MTDLDLVEGDYVCLSLSGIAGDLKDGFGFYVSFDDEGGRVLSYNYGTGARVAVPKGAHRMRCGIVTPDASRLKPIDTTAYPMLVKGDKPAPYYVPYVVGGGIPELWPEYKPQTVNGIAIEPAEGGYRVHGTATANANIWVKADLEAGAAYLASISSTSPDVYAQVYRSGQTVAVRDGAPKRFEALGGEYFLYVKVNAGKTVDAIARPSLIRIGEAGGVSNLVGRAPVTVHKFNKTDAVEVTPDGVRYKVSNSWGGTFVMLDLEPGTYKTDAKVSICTQKVSEYWGRNQYYSEKLGEAYTCETGGQPFSISENAKLGFSLPQGEGVVHPSIVRIL